MIDRPRRSSDRYGPDVLAKRSRRPAPPPATEIPAKRGLVAECARTGYCGAVIATEKTAEGWAVRLEDRNGTQRVFPLAPAAFLIDGRPVTLTLPAVSAPRSPQRSASGSRYVANAPAQVARASRIWVEGAHDAELLELVWGHDLRIAGIVVEPLHGADHLADALRLFAPGPQRRVGVLLDHLVRGSKESRIAAEATRDQPHVQVAGHPFVDIWQAVKPAAVGIAAWPDVPRGQPWKQGMIEELGWRVDERGAWARISAAVRSYTDIEPALVGPVERLIDFVTEPDTEVLTGP